MSDTNPLHTGADENPALGTPSEGAESAPATGENPDQNTATPSGEGSEGAAPSAPAEPAGFTKRIHKKHHELMEERRQREALEQELETLRTSQAPAKPEIPAVPDRYDFDTDEEYNRRMADRDKAITDAAQWEANRSAEALQRQNREVQNFQQQQQQQAEAVQTYVKRAETLGVKPEELQLAAQSCAAYGITMQLTEHLIRDELGPAIAVHFAENPDVLEQVVAMDPMSAAVHIATVIKPSIAKQKPAGAAPPPPDTLDGGGVPPNKRGPKGARYS